jgi:hypothetical protein
MRSFLIGVFRTPIISWRVAHAAARGQWQWGSTQNRAGRDLHRYENEMLTWSAGEFSSKPCSTGDGIDHSSATGRGRRQRRLQRLLAAVRGNAMKRIIALAVPALALVAGTAVVITVHPQQAVAGCGTPQC